MKIRKNIYTKKDVDAIKAMEFSNGVNRGLDIAIQELIVIPMMFLRDKEGYGFKRLGDFIDYFKMSMDCLDEDRVELKEMADALERETGIEFKGVLEKD